MHQNPTAPALFTKLEVKPSEDGEHLYNVTDVEKTKHLLLAEQLAAAAVQTKAAPSLCNY